VGKWSLERKKETLQKRGILKGGNTIPMLKNKEEKKIYRVEKENRKRKSHCRGTESQTLPHRAVFAPTLDNRREGGHWIIKVIPSPKT